MSVRFYLLFVIGFCATAVYANDIQVQNIISSSKAPIGVVFEIASSDPDALRWAIPKIKRYSMQLRAQFPKLELAVVTHGREQFALQKINSVEYQKVHNEIKQLAESEDIPIHVCQTFAAWNGVDPEDFPDYVAVSVTGPQQVNDYLELGYTLIRVRSR